MGRTPGKSPYTEVERRNTIWLLKENEWDVNAVSKLVPIGKPVLQKWAIQGQKEEQQRQIDIELEKQIFFLLDHMPDPKDMKTPGWAITVATLIDKMLLLRGGATSRKETVITTLSDDDLLKRLARAEKALSLPEGDIVEGRVLEENGDIASDDET